MKSAADRLHEARRAEREARARWLGTLSTAQARFAPDAIAKDAMEQVRESAGEAADKLSGAVRKRPGTIAAVGAAIGLFLFRKPIAAAVRTRIDRRKKAKAGIRSLTKERQSGQGPIADPTPKSALTEEV
ncbi:hypothetical protein [Parasphingopyxis lamellibrachiae]|uniref:DUF3618 domain-containing protein n=1 Tax=Parasphingopyxis lamellibrachiae TaxID=680125 RepID=A0A3D9FDA0_9SPHN|nr:hypothetical protein [Parasphingopyxis lamellibrachiae]RED15537.1 hypothetical protein DFR46_0532 [Parasphingopyxis lamellibrachiae]